MAFTSSNCFYYNMECCITKNAQIFKEEKQRKNPHINVCRYPIYFNSDRFTFSKYHVLKTSAEQVSYITGGLWQMDFMIRKSSGCKISRCFFLSLHA